MAEVAPATARPTYVLVDGENIDMTLGGILGHRPDPTDRPRWERLLQFVERTWGAPARGLFFLNASDGHPPYGFINALVGLGYRPIPLAARPDQADVKVVDVGIQRTLEALEDGIGDVVLVSHDGDFIDHLVRIAGHGRRTAVIGFAEYLNPGYRELQDMSVFDLETDVGAFDVRLPRITVIPLDDYDPRPLIERD
jgi:putative heme uptake system protein